MYTLVTRTSTHKSYGTAAQTKTLLKQNSSTILLQYAQTYISSPINVFEFLGTWPPRVGILSNIHMVMESGYTVALVCGAHGQFHTWRLWLAGLFPFLSWCHVSTPLGIKSKDPGTLIRTVLLHPVTLYKVKSEIKIYACCY